MKPLTFLVVTFECIGKIQWFLAHVNYIHHGVMQILCKFCHNKHFTRSMAPRTINMTDCRWHTTFKNVICCTPANSSSLITSTTHNNARVQMSTASWTCVQYVHHSPVRHPAGDASTAWLILPSMNLCDNARHSSRIACFNCSTFSNFLPWYTRSCRAPPSGIIHRV